VYEKMVRPSADSLNSLAHILHRAQPLYAEYRSILNYLDAAKGAGEFRAIEILEGSAMKFASNDDALTTHRTVFEQEPISRNRIM
jgi:hypothetical protein